MIRLLSLVLLLALSSFGANAADLDQAKSQGLVCELPTGYLKAMDNAGGDVKDMVKEINKKREAEYARIAGENGVEANQVALLTAKKLSPKCP